MRLLERLIVIFLSVIRFV